jgi:flagellar motor switch protein FliN
MTALEQIRHLADIHLDVEVELDRRIMTLREIMELQAGSVIKLPRSAGENLDIVVAGTTVGSGEIVIIEDSVGVRITDFHEEV